MSKARDFLEELNVPKTLEDLPEPTPRMKDLLPTLEQDIIDLVLLGYSVEDIGLRLVIPKSVALATMKRKDIQEAISSSQEVLDSLRIGKLKAWYDGVLDARMAEVENAGETTRKDTLEVVKAYGDLLMQEKKSRKPEAEQNVYLNILSQVIGD